MVGRVTGVSDEQGTDAQPDRSSKEGEFLQVIPLYWWR
jgi:hypothetical protein